jgi:hypothetical protein
LGCHPQQDRTGGLSDTNVIRGQFGRPSRAHLTPLQNDVRLVFHNAMRYNKPETPWHKTAKALLKKADALFEELQPQDEHEHVEARDALPALLTEERLAGLFAFDPTEPYTTPPLTPPREPTPVRDPTPVPVEEVAETPEPMEQADSPDVERAPRNLRLKVSKNKRANRGGDPEIPRPNDFEIVIHSNKAAPTPAPPPKKSFPVLLRDMDVSQIIPSGSRRISRPPVVQSSSPAPSRPAPTAREIRDRGRSRKPKPEPKLVISSQEVAQGGDESSDLTEISDSDLPDSATAFSASPSKMQQMENAAKEHDDGDTTLEVVDQPPDLLDAMDILGAPVAPLSPASDLTELESLTGAEDEDATVGAALVPTGPLRLQARVAMDEEELTPIEDLSEIDIEMEAPLRGPGGLFRKRNPSEGSASQGRKAARRSSAKQTVEVISDRSESPELPPQSASRKSKSKSKSKSKKRPAEEMELMSEEAESRPSKKRKGELSLTIKTDKPVSRQEDTAGDQTADVTLDGAPSPGDYSDIPALQGYIKEMANLRAVDRKTWTTEFKELKKRYKWPEGKEPESGELIWAAWSSGQCWAAESTFGEWLDEEGWLTRVRAADIEIRPEEDDAAAVAAKTQLLGKKKPEDVVVLFWDTPRTWCALSLRFSAVAHFWRRGTAKLNSIWQLGENDRFDAMMILSEKRSRAKVEEGYIQAMSEKATPEEVAAMVD